MTRVRWGGDPAGAVADEGWAALEAGAALVAAAAGWAPAPGLAAGGGAQKASRSRQIGSRRTARGPPMSVPPPPRRLLDAFEPAAGAAVRLVEAAQRSPVLEHDAPGGQIVRLIGQAAQPGHHLVVQGRPVAEESHFRLQWAQAAQ